MNLYPAIDLKNGQAVRLFKGCFDEMTIYDNNPANVAKNFEKNGFKWLHIVDLDGALAGKAVNRETVREICAVTSAKIQLGGGIRNLETIEMWLKSGVNRVILGTIAAINPEFVKLAAKNFPNQIAVGIDAKDGMVAVSGWLDTTNIKAEDLAKEFAGAGVAAIIATDIARDGTKTGINIEFTQNLAKAVDIPIIASGGLKGVSEIETLKNCGIKNIDGVILGKALYDGLINPFDAIKAAANGA